MNVEDLLLPGVIKNHSAINVIRNMSNDNVKVLVKDWLGIAIGTITLSTMIIGMVVYFNNIANDVKSIKTNELVHVQASLTRVEEAHKEMGDRMINLETSIGRIEGILSK